MLDIHQTQIFKSVMDLQELLPNDLPKKFDTAELAAGLNVPRHQAQQIGYVLRKTGVAKEVGKRGNAILYQLVTKRESTAQLKKKRPKISRKIEFNSSGRLTASSLNPKATVVTPVKKIKKRKTTAKKPAASALRKKIA